MPRAAYVARDGSVNWETFSTQEASTTKSKKKSAKPQPPELKKTKADIGELSDCTEQISFGFDAVVEPGHAANPLEKFFFGKRVRVYRTMTRWRLTINERYTNIDVSAPKGHRSRYSQLDPGSFSLSDPSLTWSPGPNETRRADAEIELVRRLGLPVNRPPLYPHLWIPNPCHTNASPGTFLRWRREKFDTRYQYGFVVGETLVRDGHLLWNDVRRTFTADRTIRALEILMEKDGRGPARIMLALPEDLMAA